MPLAAHHIQVQDEAGNAQGSASIEVRSEVAGAPLALLYSDRDGTVNAGNPITADADGSAEFYVAGGAYRITATKGAFSQTWRYVAIGLAQESDFLSTGVRYRFSSSTTDSDPGENFLKFNNASLASVTEIYISDIGESDADISTFLDTFDDGGETSNRGNLFIESGDGNGFILFRVTGTVANDGSPSTYRTVTGTVLASSGEFTENRVCSILFNQAGGGLSSPVSLSDIQDITTARILGRDTAGSGVIEQLTIDEVLALAGAPSDGDILSFDGSNYVPRGGMILLTSGSVSAAATLDLVLSSYSAYRGFKIFSNLIPVTGGAEAWIRTSTDGGSSYDAGASDYAYSSTWFGSSTNGIDQSAGDSKLLMNGNVSGSQGITSEILFFDHTNASLNPRLTWDTQAKNSSGLTAHTIGGGFSLGSAADAIRLMFSTGNIDSGEYALYGLS